MKEIILRLSDGQNMTFSEQELIAIVEEHLQSKKSNVTQSTMKAVEALKEGEWFKVNPLAIDPNLFKEKREDSKQEVTRQYILEAFEEMKKNVKYAGPFKTMIPKRTWESRTVGELKMLAKILGDHIADWVEQALEWAQRIANGESWEDICNNKDTANCYRVVVWKNQYARIVGGARSVNNFPASDVDNSDNFHDHHSIYAAVPLVVSYDV